MELVATKRTEMGRAAKALRTKGLIAAELYGPGQKNEHVSVTEKDFRRVFRASGETTLINLMLEGQKHPVMIHEVSTHPVSDAILNIDFYQVDLKKEIELKVPLIFSGEAPAVKEKGGVLIKSVTEISVRALPSDIPHNIEISIVPLADIGQSISLKDIPAPAGVKFLGDEKTVVATVIAKMTEEEEAKLAAEVDVSAVKSETEEKVAERAAEAATAPAEGAPAAAPGKPAEAKPAEKK